MPQPGQSFKLPPFTAGEPLIDQLTASRMNAIVDAIEANRPVFGINTTGRRAPGGTIIRANPAAAGGAGRAAQLLPFAVTQHTSITDPGPPPVSTIDGVTILPGLVTTFIPTISGVKLSDTVPTPPPPHPPVLIIGGTCSVFLQCKLDMTDTVHFQNGITEVLCVTDEAALTNAEYDSITGEVKELNIKWDSGDTGPRTTGYFYLKIADVEVKVSTDTPPVTTFVITQWLFDNIRTFICVGKNVIILV